VTQGNPVSSSNAMPERMSTSAPSVIAAQRGPRGASAGTASVTGWSSDGTLPSSTARASNSAITVFEIENAAAGRSARPPLPYHSHASAPSRTTTNASAPPRARYAGRSGASGSLARAVATASHAGASGHATGVAGGGTRTASFHS
jgi:hypothetical protein